jgi:hypothetical protein
MTRASTRLRLEAAAGCVSFILFVVTLVWPDWIELACGFDPDHGDGSVEWSIVAVTALATVTLGLLARREWRRLSPAAD